MLRQIAALAVVLLLICVANRLASGNTYAAYVPAGNVRVHAADPGRLRLNETQARGGQVRVNVSPRQPGSAAFYVYEDGMRLERHELRITPMYTIYDVTTGGFTGDGVVMVSVSAFYLLVAAILFRYCMRVEPPTFYAYTTIYAAGFSLFSLLTGATMSYVTLRHLLRPSAFSMLRAYDVVSRAGYVFMLSTAPLIVVFAIAMTISNIALMRHEKPRLKNALGILAGLMLMGGEVVAFMLDRSGLNRPGSDENLKQLAFFVFPSIFVYFECMLIGAILCGIQAARHVPNHDKDCLVILGCWFRKDGTLTPLLRGRVDKAIEFWNEQKAETGREALFIPSGGQGRDEPMPEAEAMARYLRTQGVPDGLIFPETRSKNTYQNMAFSREIIERVCPGAKTAFVTTNYHVFRSGVWANLAGLPSEGLGGPTRWWYWPNAFMRECAGLLVNRWKQEILLLVAMIFFFGLLAALL